MINITDKQDCCGCAACYNVCPVKCIEMRADSEGFLYPFVNTELCIECGLCLQVCPFINPGVRVKDPDAYAAINKDEFIRMNSSSGGVFSTLAESIIVAGGVVFGARWDSEWGVKHDFTETLEGVAAFRGSKYLQSRIGDSYVRAKDFLDAGRKVLFSGTPCQIAGLKRFLRKEYTELLAVDVICHGTPSPKVFQSYLAQLVKDKTSKSSEIRNISFRHKKKPFSWHNAGFMIWRNGSTDDGYYIEPSFQNAFG
ncbi:MAG: Coenzyme F420 hydrogenase/dehydrogenase, beta subunit C-terminal domain [Bacteroidales bacterium]|nr:Coenzyme F420 hydrogenase/dehydrogenase, beta subunit C-terminal domain [Bacteroidales bacterium]